VEKPTSRSGGLSVRLVALVAFVVVLVGCGPMVEVGASGSESSSGSARNATARMTLKLPAIRHVFVIMLENEGYQATFGTPSKDPYLAQTLPSEGALLTNYYAIGHFSLDNYVAFVSGQPPNSDTQSDCIGGYDGFPGADGQETWHGAPGIQEGTGCVYPPAVQTVADQLVAKGFTWKGYMEDMGNNPTRDGSPTSTCGHPNLNKPDPAVSAVQGDGYATRHDPFVYFDSIVGTSRCSARVVPLGSATGAMPQSDTVGATGLATDLKSASTTPNLSFITPNVCDDGHDYPCVNETSPGTSALADIDSFLSTWVPLITASPAFKQDGLLEVTFDESDTSDTTSCCGEKPGPTGVAPGQSNGPGGGLVGSVLISPFVKAKTVFKTKLNHYSSLASIEDLFGLSRLGDAKTVPTTFDSVYKK
jgi:hypothetical protein